MDIAVDSKVEPQGPRSGEQWVSFITVIIFIHAYMEIELCNIVSLLCFYFFA